MSLLVCLNEFRWIELTIPGNLLYDLFMGVELNPQIAKLGDIKLFINGRTGMMAWPLMLV